MYKMRLLTIEEAEALVIRILKEKGPLLTRQIEEEIFKRNLQCPDSTQRTLNKLRIKGSISGELSLRERAWRWWI
jgi:predicted transcriptional regulator